MKVKKEYSALLESGELLIMFPELSGVWKKDKTAFTRIWEENKRAIKDIDIDFEDDV